MLSKLLILVFLCLCATSSFGTLTTVDPDAIATSDQWDSTGGAATKTIAITDATDGTYIFTATNGNTDRYDVEDLPDDCEENEVDSVLVYWTAQDNGTGNNRARIGIRIKDDDLFGGSISLTTSWVERIEVFINPPGSRGSWDLVEFDSVEVQINCSAIGGSREVRMTSCSLVVFYRSINRTYMFPFKDDACLTTGISSDYDHDLLRKSFMQNDTSFTDILAGAATHLDYWKTGDQASAYHKMNNDDWETGGFGVFFDVVHVKSDCSLKIVVQRYNSSCVLQESAPEFPASGAQLLVDTTGHYEFQIPQHDWSSGACGDEIAIRFEWTNVIGEAEDSIWVRYGVGDTYFEHEIGINASGCAAGEGSGDCGTDTLTMDPDNEGDLDTWVEVGSAGGKWEAVADGIDANYDSTFVQGNHQTFEMGGFTEPADFSTYDSIHFEFKAAKDVSGKTIRIRLRMYDETNRSNFCETNNINIQNTAFADFKSSFSVTGTPSGPLTCEGAMTEAQIEKIEIEFRAVTIAAQRSLRVTKAQLVICYTTAVAGAGQVIRIQLGMIDPVPEWERKWWAGIEHPLYPNRGLVWGITKDSKMWIKKCAACDDDDEIIVKQDYYKGEFVDDDDYGMVVKGVYRD